MPQSRPRVALCPDSSWEDIVSVNDIKEPQVRRWRKKLLDSGVSEVTTAKAYRLLKAIRNTAVDAIIRRNPCRIKGAGQEESAERPVLSIAEVTRSPTRSTRGTAYSSCSAPSRACVGRPPRRYFPRIREMAVGSGILAQRMK
jgi:hypothetical protein